MTATKAFSKKRHAVSGMTLVEIIIALFVFSVASLILVQAGKAVNTITMNGNHVNKKTSMEAPLVENGYVMMQHETETEKLTDPTTHLENGQIKVIIKDVNPGNANIKPVSDKMKVSMDVDGHDVAIVGYNFSVQEVAKDKSDAKTSYDLQYVYVPVNVTKRGGSLWVYDPTEPTTEATT
jgi:prepilin-type N-terminal cleavage/methylation domain-containing protein